MKFFGSIAKMLRPNYKPQIDPVSGLKRVRQRQTREQLMNGWGGYDGNGLLPLYWQYFCNKCDQPVTPGPSGAGTNQVCEGCRINFGCLEDALER